MKWFQRRSSTALLFPIICALCAEVAVSEAAEEVRLVVPDGLELLEGDFVTLSTPAPPNGFREQDLHVLAEFSTLPLDHDTIVSMAWRPDEGVTNPVNFEVDVFELRLSTTASAPGTLSETFADNVGNDETLVYRGPIQFQTEGHSEWPTLFDYHITFQKPFVYDRSQDTNLLVDIRMFHPIQGFPSLDSHRGTNSSAHAVFAIDATAETALATGVGTSVKQFGFLPAPSTDCNVDGKVDSADLSCVSSIEYRDAVLAVLNTLPGDLDGNGDVSFADFLVLSANFGTDLRSYADGNIDLNDGIEFADFLVLSNNFGMTAQGVAAVPEPFGLVLMALGVTAAGRYRSATRARQPPRQSA